MLSTTLPCLRSSCVLITGATSGIGRACAKLYAERATPEHPVSLIVTGRRQAMLSDLCSELSSHSNVAHVHPVACDVSDRAAMMDALTSLPSSVSDVEVLVNNAGLALGTAPIQEGDIDDWESMIDVNLKGLLYCTRAIVPGMVERGRGHVVNVGSVAGNYALPGGNVYCGTKAFVNHLSLAMRADLIGKGVKVTSVEPGNTETEFSVVRFKGDKAKADGVYEAKQGPRVACTGEDVANIVYFATDELPRHVNINKLEVMPERQGFGPFAFHRD
mmetsp:Transcript_14316/g.29232  ORF Transcript_14316/g.29232 Transcript_14316/m.29232 type:complete len:274 (+) Transcript_14316:36-857(+)